MLGGGGPHGPPPPSALSGGAHRRADEGRVPLGQAVGLPAVVNGGKGARIEWRETEKLQDSVRDAEPVPREVLVDDLAGLDARRREPPPPAVLALLRKPDQLYDPLHVGRWVLRLLVRPQDPLIGRGGTPPRDALPHLVRTPQPDVLSVRERRPHELQARIGPSGRTER